MYGAAGGEADDVSDLRALDAPNRRHRRSLLIGIAVCATAAVCAGVAAVIGAGRRRAVGAASSSSLHAASATATTTAAAAAATATVTTPPLSFTARSDGYAPLPSHTLRTYGLRWTHVVEPHKSTLLEATNRADNCSGAAVSTYAWSVAQIEVDAGGQASASSSGMVLEGAEATLVFDAAGTTWAVTLTETTTSTMSSTAATASHGASLTAVTTRIAASTSVACKYVRREVRDLTAADRDAYLDALRIVYSYMNATSADADEATGRLKYGANFRGGAHFVALHASSEFCYHGNLAFLTTHPAFTLQLERSLQAIDPRVSQPYWDFTRDHALGARWVDAPVYSAEWFGSVDNGASSGYRPRNGRFREVATLLDDAAGGRRYPHARHNAYGYVSSQEDASRSPLLQRSASVCGYQSTQPPSSCSKLRGCFANYSSLATFDLCLEADVHANLHGMNAGMWDCEVDVNASAAEMVPGASDALLSFVFVTVSDVIGKYPKYFPHLDCPANCSLATGFDACRCAFTGNGSVETMTDAQVYHYVEDALGYLLDMSYEGPLWIERTPNNVSDGMPLRFRGLSNAASANLRRLYLRVLSAPGQFSPMGTGAATNDPLFWVMHPLFEKAWQVLRLAPPYADNAAINTTWDNGFASAGCNGTGWHDATPFEDLFDDGPAGRYTNAQLWELFDPSGGHIPYVYDQFTQWGDCAWDPWDEAA